VTSAPSVVRSALRAWMVAGTLSGVPSTTWSLLQGQDLLAPARAAGTVLPDRLGRSSLPAGVAAHAAISAWWILILTVLARRRDVDSVFGAAAGLGIAALDLGIARRRYPAIAALDQVPQWLDHVAFGALAGRCLRDLGPGRDG